MLLVAGCADELGPGEDAQLRTEAKAFAKTVIEERTTEGSEADEFWGLDDCVVFGRSMGIGSPDSWAPAAGSSTLEFVGEEDGIVTYRLRVPAWVRGRGRNSAAKLLQRKRTGHFQLSLSPDGEWRLDDESREDLGDLGFMERLTAWAFGLLVVPVAIAGFGLLFIRPFWKDAAGPFVGLSTLFALGHFGWNSFGHWFAGLAAIGAYVFLFTLAMAAAVRARE